VRQTLWHLGFLVALSNARKADVLLIIVTLLAALSWLFSKEAVGLMPPLLFMAVRFTLAGIVLALWGLPQLLALNALQWRRGLRVGLCFGAGMSLWIMGLFRGTHVGEGAFLTSLGVVLVPVISRLVFGERAPLSTWLALPVAAAGLALLSLQEGFTLASGQLFYVGAAVLFALYYTLNTRAANHREAALGDVVTKVPALPLTAVVLLTVGALTTGLSAFYEPWLPTVQAISSEMVAWVLASALLGSAARFLIQTYAQSLSAHSNGVIIMIVEPVWTASLAAFWLGERMSPQQLFGCAVILLALLVSRAWPQTSA